MAHSSEFENIMVREEEQQELANVVRKSCPLEVRGGPEDKYGKINILIQVFWSPSMVQFTVDLHVWRHYRCHHDHKFKCASHM